MGIVIAELTAPVKEKKESKIVNILPKNIKNKVNISIQKHAKEEKPVKEKKLSDMEKVVEMLYSGDINTDDLFDDEGVSVPINELAGTDEVEEVENIIEDSEYDGETIMPFNFGSFYMDDEGNVIEATSSKADEINIDTNSDNSANNSIIDIINNDDDLKDIDIDNAYIDNGMLLIDVNRGENKETFRLDYYNNKLYVQAPMDSPIPDYNKQILYKYISVPVDSDIGKEILNNENYIVDSLKVPKEDCILRDAENAS